MQRLCLRWVYVLLYAVVMLLTVSQWVVFVKAVMQLFVLMSSPYTSLSLLNEGLIVSSVPLVLAVLLINLCYVQLFTVYTRQGIHRILDHAAIILPLNVCTLACGSFLFFI